MVEINNQRKAFLDMLAWSEGTDNGRQNQKSWLWRHCRRDYLPIGLITPQICHAKPKTKINRRRTLPVFPVGGMPTARSHSGKTFRKVRTLWHCSIMSVALTHDWSWWYPSGNRPLQQYLASLPGAGYGQFEHKADSLIAKFVKRAERSERLMYEYSRLSPLWLSASSSACHGLLIITVITPLPTKPSDKNARELKLA